MKQLASLIRLVCRAKPGRRTTYYEKVFLREPAHRFDQASLIFTDRQMTYKRVFLHEAAGRLDQAGLNCIDRRTDGR
jgi:hypothetical protein